jgi:hypothetical protein
MKRIRFGVAALVVASAGAFVGVAGTGVAHAAPPPITGNVSCTLSGQVGFLPPLGWQRGKVGRNFGPNANTKTTVSASLTGCTGAQAGGNPKKPGPIDHGVLTLRALAVKHSCASFSSVGATVKAFKVDWYDGAGTKIAITKGKSGAVTATGLGAGIPSSWPPQPPFPPTVPPGYVSLQFSGAAAANATAFPGATATWSGTVDQTIDGDFQMPCSYTTPPLPGGVGGFGLTGVNGPATFSIAT